MKTKTYVLNGKVQDLYIQKTKYGRIIAVKVKDSRGISYIVALKFYEVHV